VLRHVALRATDCTPAELSLMLSRRADSDVPRGSANYLDTPARGPLACVDLEDTDAPIGGDDMTKNFSTAMSAALTCLQTGRTV